MTAVTVRLSRVFRYEGIDLPDPDETMDTVEVLAHYTQQYPRLAGGKVVEIGVEGDKLVNELRHGAFGDKG